MSQLPAAWPLVRKPGNTTGLIQHPLLTLLLGDKTQLSVSELSPVHAVSEGFLSSSSKNYLSLVKALNHSETKLLFKEIEMKTLASVGSEDEMGQQI